MATLSELASLLDEIEVLRGIADVLKEVRQTHDVVFVLRRHLDLSGLTVLHLLHQLLIATDRVKRSKHRSHLQTLLVR